MLSHEEMIALQAEKHEVIEPETFRNNKDFVLHLIHTRAYEQAALYAAEKKVLDLGCNTGYGSRILKAAGADVTGVDVSPEAIAIARKKYGPAGIEFLCTDGGRLPFAERSFDLVTSFQVIEHLVDQTQFLEEIQRVIKPGGRVILTTPNGPLRLHPGTRPWNPFHVREFSADELHRLLRGYFPKVEMLGLFAVKPLYSVEYERIRIIRERARIKQSPEGASLAGRIKLFLLHLEAEFRKKSHNLNRQFQKRYTSRDLYYKRENLDAALDLMAVCTVAE